MRSLGPAFALFIVLSPAAFAQSDWQAQKCAAYEKAWTQALSAIGSDNINYNFLAQNENFIASGCTEITPVCPQSSQEIEIADFLTIALMNEGAASTFLPFACDVE